MIVFSGGEPTIRKDIRELVRVIQESGLKTGLITNGRRFSYPGFGQELATLGFCFAYVSFHSPRREKHALSARTDSLPEVLAAIENLVRLQVQVTVNTVVTRDNITDLEDLVDMLAQRRPDKIKLSVLEPKGAALEDPGLAPALGESARAMGSALRYGRDRYPHLRFGCEGLPPCLLEDFETLNDDLIADGFVLFQEAFEKDFSPPDYKNRSKPRTCLKCAHFERCPGIFTGYCASL